jgi:hypothetical protein
MRTFIFLACITVNAMAGGCGPHDDDASKALVADSKADQTAQRQESAPGLIETDPVLFRGEYDRTTGPCIDLGDGVLAMPFMDTFRVLEVLEGTLHARIINVRAMTEGGSGYPKDLKEGQVYTLRLTPSADTSRQLREADKDGLTFLWINGQEIAERRLTE